MIDLGSWFILRTANADTVKALDAFKAAGFNVWTPIELKVRRTPRKRTQYDSKTALLPSYLFAHVNDLEPILSLALRTSRDIPRFTVFHHKDGVPLIADSSLGPLRQEESRVARIFERVKLLGRKAPKLSPGSTVRMPDGPLMGLDGIVEGQEGQYTLVSFNGFAKPLKISSILLIDPVAKAA